MAAGTSTIFDPGRAGELRGDAERISSRLPPLLVEAERVAATIEQGTHGRRRIGIGETFWQFRRAREGDAHTAINWRQSAKSDKLFVRENEWEAAETVWFWCDRSASMAYGTGNDWPDKGYRAGVVTLALANLLIRGSERVGLVSHAGGTPRPMTGRRALDHVVEALTGPTREQSVPPAQQLPRYSRLVLVGDFLSPVEEIEPVVTTHASRGLTGHLVQVMDPAEEDLPFAGRTTFRDPESSGKITYQRPQVLRREYADKLAAHRAALLDLTRSVGWTFAYHRTDAPAESVVLSLFTTLSGSRALGRA